jgi:N-acetylmuramoyl-L-alanine amidase
MRPIKYLIIHHNGVPGRTLEDVKRSHLANGWKDIGYHYVIEETGLLRQGRPLHKPGAHVEGLNTPSIGICLIGNGNTSDFNPRQYETLKSLLDTLLARFPDAQILGHRETGPFVPAGKATKKACPGIKVSMIKIRGMVDRGPETSLPNS